MCVDPLVAVKSSGTCKRWAVVLVKWNSHGELDMKLHSYAEYLLSTLGVVLTLCTMSKGVG